MLVGLEADVVHWACAAVLERVAEFLPKIAKAEEKLQALLQVCGSVLMMVQERFSDGWSCSVYCI